MSKLIIKKDNGLFAVWTTVCDDFLMDDSTQKEIIEQLSEWAKKDERKRLEDQIKNDIHISTDYEEFIERRNELHGKNN